MGDGGSGWSPRPSGPGRAPPPSGTQRQWRCPRGRVYPNSPRPLAGSAEPWRGSVRGEYRSGVNLRVPSISDTERRRPLGIPPRPQLPPGGPMRRPDMRVAASELTAAWPSGRPGEEVGGGCSQSWVPHAQDERHEGPVPGRLLGAPAPARGSRSLRTSRGSSGARVGAGSTSQPNGDRLAGWYLETVGGHVVQIRCSQKIRPRVV